MKLTPMTACITVVGSVFRCRAPFPADSPATAAAAAAQYDDDDVSE